MQPEAGSKDSATSCEEEDPTVTSGTLGTIRSRGSVRRFCSAWTCQRPRPSSARLTPPPVPRRTIRSRIMSNVAGQTRRARRTHTGKTERKPMLQTLKIIIGAALSLSLRIRYTLPSFSVLSLSSPHVCRARMRSASECFAACLRASQPAADRAPFRCRRSRWSRLGSPARSMVVGRQRMWGELVSCSPTSSHSRPPFCLVSMQSLQVRA